MIFCADALKMLGLKAVMWDKYDINSYINIMSRKQQYQSSIFKGCRRHGRNKKNPDRGRKQCNNFHIRYLFFRRNKKNPDRGRKLLFIFHLTTSFFRRNKKNPDRGRKLISVIDDALVVVSRNKKNPDRGRKHNAHDAFLRQALE